MAILRVLAVALALALMVGELWRSWGADRELISVVDDQIMGALLLAGAWVMKRDTVRARALFASAWGFNAGLLCSSFVVKLVAPEKTNAGNWNMLVVTVLVGLAFATSVVGMVGSVTIPLRKSCRA